MFAHAERLNKSGIPFIFDLGQAMPLFDRDDLERMLKMTQALTVNDYEASVVQIAPVRARPVVDPTGCGDSQRGGLLYGLTCGWSWEDSCRLGNVMGALKIASRGPQNYAPSRAEIDAVLHATYGIHLPA